MGGGSRVRICRGTGRGKKCPTAVFGFVWEGAGVSVLVGFLALVIRVRAADGPLLMSLMGCIEVVPFQLLYNT